MRRGENAQIIKVYMMSRHGYFNEPSLFYQGKLLLNRLRICQPFQNRKYNIAFTFLLFTRACK